MKTLSILIATLCAALSVSAQDLSAHFAPLGKLTIAEFANAPFPHPARAQGYTHKGKVFPAAEHYSDSHVAMFVPKNMRVTDKIDFVVHFHGWKNGIAKTLTTSKLIEQFAASGRNAVLVVPQGPYEASDSFGGKLEDPEGFKRFMDEAMDKLRNDGLFTRAQVGKIILTAHSGGYQVVSSILTVGGMNDKIKEVWLFDGLYFRAEKFAAWQKENGGRFVNIYTEKGGTKTQTDNLMADFKKTGISFYSGEESKTKVADLRRESPVFILSNASHDEVIYKNDQFRKFLETSILNSVKAKPGVPTPRSS